MTLVLDRESSGIRVEVEWLPITETGVVRVAVDGVSMAATVERERLIDAYTHPMLYLAPAQVAALFQTNPKEEQ